MERVHRRLVVALLLLGGALAACDGGSSGETTAGAGGSGGATTTTSSGGGTADGGGGAGGEGGSSECATLPAGPFEPALLTNVFDGSEDFAFDGKGQIAAKRGPNIILVDSSGQTQNFASVPGTVFGLRYRSDGFLIAARPEMGIIAQIAPAGDVSTLASDLLGPNGVYPDENGNVWVTEFTGDRVIRINQDASIDELVSGAPDARQPNGILLDSRRNKLFYTNYAVGEIRSLDPAAGTPASAVVAQIEDTALDGLAMDACGNLYAVDNRGNGLYRVRLDAGGAAVGQPELLASFQTSVANALFGSGPGFDAKALYVAGASGSIYSVPVGVAGAEVPVPP
jgi:sugar lactone lactonase YvrE